MYVTLMVEATPNPDPEPSKASPPTFSIPLIHQPPSTHQTLLHILHIQTEALKALHDYLYDRGLVQLMPVLLSPITDPLNHDTLDAKIPYFDQELQLTKSMIFHKQLAIATTHAKGIYIMSPNVRLETPEKKDSGRHLIEFTQVDIELRDATTAEFMNLLEGLIVSIFTRIQKKCAEALLYLDAPIHIPTRPFPIYSSEELRSQYGENFESHLSHAVTDPFWITDYRREFYDKEDPARPGHYLNYDLFYPEGFNEALSGGERDYEHDILVRKIKERHQSLKPFTYFLEKAQTGVLVPSAGGGLGIERLVRFLTKRSHIRDIAIFPRVPGEHIPF